jgi:uncharacterized membrane protein
LRPFNRLPSKSDADTLLSSGIGVLYTTFLESISIATLFLSFFYFSMIYLFILAIPAVAVIAYLSLSSRIRSLEDALRKIDPEALKQSTLESRTSFQESPLNIPEKPEQNPIHPSEKLKPAIKSSDIEIKLGGKLFTAVGVIAVLFGVGFFLRYAFENNLISPVLRVALGFTAAVLCLGLGEWLRKKYAAYGQTLMGLGLGIAYLTWYATLHFYHLIHSPVAFIGMMLVTAIGLALSVRLNSIPLAIFAQIGGFLTPPLIGGRENQYLLLFFYILILDLAVFALGYLKSWRELTLIGIIGTAAVFTSWFSAFHADTPWIFPFLFLTLYFILFSITGLLRYKNKQPTMDKADLFILALSPFLYAIGIYYLIPDHLHLLTGTWFGAIGLIYLAIASLISNEEARHKRYQNALSVIGTALIAIAVPIAFKGISTVVAWAIVAAALIAWGYIIKSRLLLILAHAMTFFAVLGTVVHLQNQIHPNPWLNTTAIGAVIVLACLAASVWVHHAFNTSDIRLTKSEREVMRSLLLIQAYVLSCFVVWMEMQRMVINDVWIIAAISLLTFIAAWIGLGLHSFAMRTTATIISGILFLVFFAFFTPPFIIVHPLTNPRFLTGLLFIVTIGVRLMLEKRSQFLRPQERELNRNFLFVGMHLFGLFLFSSEISAWFNAKLYSLPSGTNEMGAMRLQGAKNASLSVLWTVYALALLAFGILKKSLLARRFALILFSITILKAFLYDTSTLDNLYRFVSFITLGILLLLTGYLYHRFKDRMKKFVL